MGWNTPIESWDAVWGDVQGYDRATVLATAADVFRGLERTHGALVRVSKEKKPKKKGDPTIPSKAKWANEGATSTLVNGALVERLTRLFPRWYDRHNWRVGNETFGGCSCCAFPRALSKGPDEGALWVATELETMLEALRAWAPICQRISEWDDPKTRPAAVQAGVGEMIDVMVDRSWLSEGWYNFTDDGARWLLSVATGMRTDDPLLVELSSWKFKFTSWTGPTEAQRAQFVEYVASLARAY